MTAITDDEALTPDDAQIPDDTAPDVQDNMAAARLAGYSWDAIHGHLAQSTDTALAAGYSPEEINSHLGYQDQGRVADRLSDDALRAYSADDEKRDPSAGVVDWAKVGTDTPAIDMLSPDLRQEYANSVKAGEIGSPEDFGKDYQQATGAPAEEVAAHLPSNEDLTDHSIALLDLGGYPTTPELIKQVKSGLLDRFADTGEHPADVLAQAKDSPEITQDLTQSPDWTKQASMEDLMVPGRDAAVNLGPQMVMTAAAMAGGLPAVAAMTLWGVKDLPAQVEQHRDKIEAMKQTGFTPEQISEEEKNNPAWNAAFQLFAPGIAAGTFKGVKVMAPEIAGSIPDLLHDNTGAINVWHGTPHLFTEEPEAGAPFGAFKLSAIGSGEGAQAYGHGLYFAENKGIAEHYADTLSERNGTQFKALSEDENSSIPEMYKDRINGADDPKAEAKALLEDLTQSRDMWREQGHATPTLDLQLETVEKLAKADTYDLHEDGGHLYEAHIDAEPEHFLDWDESRQFQSPHVQAALDRIQATFPEDHEIQTAWRPDRLSLHGDEMYRDLERHLGSDKAASDALAKEGIAGVRYMDNGSRHQPDLEDDEVTRNHVIFDPKIVKITGRDGEPAPTADQARGAVVGSDIYSRLKAILGNLWTNQEGSIRIPTAFLSKEKADFRARNDEAKERGQNAMQAVMGQGARMKVFASEALEQFRAQLNKDKPGWQSWHDQQGPGHSNFNPITGQWDIHPNQVAIDHMEARPNAPVALNPKDPLWGFAQATRRINQATEAFIKSVPELASSVGRITDYWRHNYAQPAKASVWAQSEFAGKEGSSAGLKERSIPYAYDALQAGHKYANLDMIDHVLHDTAGKIDLVNAYKVRQVGLDNKDLAWSGTGPPVPGMIRMPGRLSERTLSWVDPATGEARVKNERLYGYPGWVQGYSSMVSRGIHDWNNPVWSKIYDKVQMFRNSTIGFLLGNPLWHTVNVAKETLMSGLSEMIGHFGRLELGRGLADMGLSVTMAPKIAQLTALGKRGEEAWKNPTMHPDLQSIIEHLTNANFRFSGRAPDMRVGGANPGDSTRGALPGWFKMWQTNDIRNQLAANFGRIIHGASADERGKTTAALAFPRALGAVATEAARIQQMVSHITFEKQVPWARNGTAIAEFQDFLSRNKLASEEEKDAQARYLSQHVDYKLGELNQDNLFINKTARQFLNLLPVSFGWALGFYALVGKGTAELASGLKGAATLNRFGNVGDLLGANARWLMAYPMGMALTGAVYQYLKTGKAPGQYGEQGTPGEQGSLLRIAHNLAFPAGKILPGYDKDFAKWGNALLAPGPLQERAQRALATGYGSFVNNPVANTIHDLGTGTDPVTGKKINDQLTSLNHGKPVGLLSYLWSVLEKNTMPIWLQQMGQAMKSPTPLNSGERIAGIKDAPRYANDPSGYAAMMDKVHAHELHDTARQMLAHEQKLENPDADTIASLKDTLAQVQAQLSGGGGRGRSSSGAPRATGGYVGSGGEGSAPATGGYTGGHTQVGNRTYYDRTGSSESFSGGATVFRGPSAGGRRTVSNAIQDSFGNTEPDNGIVANGSVLGQNPYGARTAMRSGGGSIGRAGGRTLSTGQRRAIAIRYRGRR